MVSRGEERDGGGVDSTVDIWVREAGGTGAGAIFQPSARREATGHV